MGPSLDDDDDVKRLVDVEVDVKVEVDDEGVATMAARRPPCGRAEKPRTAVCREKDRNPANTMVDKRAIGLKDADDLWNWRMGMAIDRTVNGNVDSHSVSEQRQL